MLETTNAPPLKPSAQSAPAAGMRQGPSGGPAGFSSHLQEALEPSSPKASDGGNAAAPQTEAPILTEADTPQDTVTGTTAVKGMSADTASSELGDASPLTAAVPMVSGDAVTGIGVEAAAMPDLTQGEFHPQLDLVLSPGAAAGLVPDHHAMVAPEEQSLAPSAGAVPLTVTSAPTAAADAASPATSSPVPPTSFAAAEAKEAEFAAQPLTKNIISPDLPNAAPSAPVMASAINAELASGGHDPIGMPDLHAALASAPLLAQAKVRDGAAPDALAAKAALRADPLTAEDAKPIDPAVLLARAISAATAAQEAGQEPPLMAEPVLRLAALEVRPAGAQLPSGDAQDKLSQDQMPWLAPMDTAPRPADAPLPSQAARGEAAPPPPTRQLAPVLVSMALGRGGDALTITLDPIELGRVEVSISQGKEAGQVRIVAERPETLALLQRDQRELDRALSQAGLGDLGRSIAFSLSSDQGRQQHQGWGQEKAQRSTGLVISAESDRSLALVPAQNRASTSLIDLAV